MKKSKGQFKIKLTRELFISKPYSGCPKCHQVSFGLTMMGITKTGYTKECFKCGHSVTKPIPKIKTKIIYIDQFGIDNIVKSLDATHPKHIEVIKDPFWIELYKKLDVLTKLHLITCPDSFYHADESAPTGYAKSLRRIYEHLSDGTTFYPLYKIEEVQIAEHFENYLQGNGDKPIEIKPEDIVFGALYEWKNKMKISVGGDKKQEQINDLIAERDKLYTLFLSIFQRWQSERGKSFEDFYSEEMQGFITGTFLASKQFLERKAGLAEKFLQTGKVDLNDILPPASMELLDHLVSISMRNGIKTQAEAYNKIAEYLTLENLDKIPALRIHTAIYAALAFQASNGRTTAPSRGVKVDVDMISGFLPYCDAMLVDRENAHILTTNPAMAKIGYTTKVFAPKDRVEFLQFLDDILKNADPAHLSMVEEIYGAKWAEPYLSILEHLN